MYTRVTIAYVNGVAERASRDTATEPACRVAVHCTRRTYTRLVPNEVDAGVVLIIRSLDRPILPGGASFAATSSELTGFFFSSDRSHVDSTTVPSFCSKILFYSQ